MRNKFSLIRRLSSILLFAGFAGIAFTACKKQEITIPPAQTEFVKGTGVYNIQDTPTTIYHVPFEVTSLSNVDRKVTYKITSSTGAVAGTQYNLPGNGTATIPADSVGGVIDIKGIYAAYAADPGRIDTLTITFTGGDAQPAAFNTSFTLIVQQYCNVVLSDLLGAYTNCFDIQTGSAAGGPYPVTITGVSTGPTSAQLVIQDFGLAYFGPFAPTDNSANPGITVNIDWSDASNFTATVVSQPFFVHPVYGLAIATPNEGTFSSCAESFTLTYDVSVSLGTFGTFTTYLFR
jgi:hypothetical protein